MTSSFVDYKVVSMGNRLLESEHDTARRAFLRGLACAVPGAMLLPWDKLAAAVDERALSFHHTHTNERLDVVYHAGGDYVPESLTQICELLRDFRTEEVHPIDPQLLDLLHDVQRAAGSSGTLQVISGYRSPKTNAMLRGKSNGVAKRSLHMQGKAIDVRISDVDSATVKQVALGLRRGGVGYYRKSDFVHLDTGRFRTW